MCEYLYGRVSVPIPRKRHRELGNNQMETLHSQERLPFRVLKELPPYAKVRSNISLQSGQSFFTQCKRPVTLGSKTLEKVQSVNPIFSTNFLVQERVSAHKRVPSGNMSRW